MLNKFPGFGAGESYRGILDRNRGVGPGFDILRIMLAVLLFICHAKWVAGAPSIGALYSFGQHFSDVDVYGSVDHAASHWVGFTRPVLLAIVPAFFALSGFLVMGSAFRLRVTSTFLAHRILRIIPALMVEVMLSAVVLGAFLTSLPLDQYFSDPLFFRYFGNILGLVTMFLPGVFENNTVREVVNVNLWTLPAEFYCYLLTAFLLHTGVIFNRKLFTIAFIVVTLGLAIAHHKTEFSSHTGPFPPHVIVYYFFVGVLFYHYQERIPALFSVFLACTIFSYLVLNFDGLIYLAPIPLTYCTIFVGMINFPKLSLISSGDYSYGIYLYGFPISQAYASLFPQLASHATLFVIVAGITTFLFAAFSWHLIEKRALGYKKTLPVKFFPVPPRGGASG